MNHRESGQQNKGKTISRRAVFQTAFEIIRCKTLWFHHLAKTCFPKSQYKKKKKKILTYYDSYTSYKCNISVNVIYVKKNKQIDSS